MDPMPQTPQLAAQAYALRSGDPAVVRAALAKSRAWYATFLESRLPVDRGARMLDVPCGAGNLLFALKAEGYLNVVGVDGDAGQVEIAKALDLPASQGDAFEALQGESAGTVSRIFCLDFIEHVPFEDALAFCRDAHRALAPGGILACRTPCADGPFGSHDRYNDLTHRWGLSSGAAIQLMQLAGFPAQGVSVVGEPPVPYKISNLMRLFLYRATTSALRLYLELCGIGAPRIWTRSMWIFAQR